MATASQASELKQQGAFEAARDPDSGVTAQAAENIAVKEAKKAGSAAFHFDPNASVEEKRAQARSVRIPALLAACVLGALTVNSTSLRASTTSGTPMRRRLPLTP